MEFQKVVDILNGKQKGTFVRIGWESSIESAKAKKAGNVVTKMTETTVRWGISYSNLEKVKEIKAQQVTEYTRKPWFKHTKENPSIIESISDENKKYLQIFTVDNKNLTKVSYNINGKEVSKQEVIDSGLVNNSEFVEKDRPLVLSIPLGKIKFIGNIQ